MPLGSQSNWFDAAPAFQLLSQLLNVSRPVHAGSLSSRQLRLILPGKAEARDGCSAWSQSKSLCATGALELLSAA